LSYGFWYERFGGDPQIIGKQIEISNTIVNVVGVTPPEFQGVLPGESTKIYLPLQFSDRCSEWKSSIALRTAIAMYLALVLSSSDRGGGSLGISESFTHRFFRLCLFMPQVKTSMKKNGDLRLSKRPAL
jgi:hypothetical protein